MASNCLTDHALLFREAAFVKPARAELQAPLASVVDVSQITGQLVTGSLTAWVTGGDQDVEHVAGATSAGDLVVFYSSPRSHGWQVVNASREAGRTVVGPFASWITRDGEYTVEHVAARGPGGELLVFYWSPRRGRWRVVDASAEAGPTIAAPATAWVTTSGEYTVEHLAAVDATGDLIVFWWSPRAGRWRAVDASREAGLKAVGPLTSWVTRDGDYTVEHVAGRAADGDLLVFYWSPRAGRWRVVNATADAGSKVAGGAADWVTQSGEYTVEHLAAAGTNGDLLVFWWSPRAGRWRVTNASQIAGGPTIPGAPTAFAGQQGTSMETVVVRGEDGGLLVHWWTSPLDWQVFDLGRSTGTRIVSDVVSWPSGPSHRSVRLAARTAQGHVLVYRLSGAEQQLTDDLRRPAFSLKRSRHVRRKVLTILWDAHKPDIPRPERAVVEAAVLGAINSVRGYYLENSDRLFTIESAGVLGWYDSKYPHTEYWPPGDEVGRDSGAEAIRRAARDFNFAAFDTNNDDGLPAEELAVLFIMPGNGDGGGLNRIVGEDFTTGDTATGITVDGVKIRWIAEVSIGAPPGPGIVAHELAHLLLGHGDMYFTFFTPSAAGAYSLMDDDGRAPHLDPFGKLKLGWLKPTIMWRSGRYRLPAVETAHSAWILIDPRRSTDEYYLIENRWPGASYEHHLPDQGFAVWHIMENPDTYNAALPPSNVSTSTWSMLGPGQWGRKAIRMIRPIETPPFNNARALWDGSDPLTGYDLLSEDPVAAHATLKWGDGTPSGFALRDISAAGAWMEAFIEVPAL